MFKIYDGREHFWQWDLNQKLIVEDPTINEVHFSNRTDMDSLPVEVYEENGLRLANVPNILLQEDLKIKAYAYSVDHTKHEAWFYVTTKSKPADYVYTETEVKDYNSLLDKISEKVDKSDILTEVDTSEIYNDNQFYNANAVNSVISLLNEEFVTNNKFDRIVAEVSNTFPTKVNKSDVLSNIDINAKPEDILIEGITQITQEDIDFAKEFGYNLKLLGIAKKDKESVELRIHPTLLPQNAMIGKVDGVMNAISVVGDNVGETLFYGAGAGGNATASAVISDIIEIARTKSSPMLGFKSSIEKNLTLKPIAEIQSAYYLRIIVLDKPGVLAQITTILGQQEISIDTFLQRKAKNKNHSTLLLSTHTCLESKIQIAIEKINNLEITQEKPVMIRIEKN